MRFGRRDQGMRRRARAQPKMAETQMYVLADSAYLRSDLNLRFAKIDGRF